MWQKRVSCFEKRLSGVKKTNSLVFYEKYSKESKTQLRQFVIVVVVVLILTLSFFTILLFDFILFDFIVFTLHFFRYAPVGWYLEAPTEMKGVLCGLLLVNMGVGKSVI